MTTYGKPTVTPAWGETNTTSADMVQPSDAEIKAGWPLSSTPPSRQRFNWILNFVANGLRYFMQRGLPDYDSAETYAIGAKIIGDDGNTYTSIANANINNTPSSSPTKWTRWGYSATDLAGSGFTTAAQFNNSTKLATTAFVQRALGSGSGIFSYNTNTTLTAQHAGADVYVNAAVTLTLPLLSAVADGTHIRIKSANSSAVVAAQGSDVLYMSTTSAASITLDVADTVDFYAWSGVGWVAMAGTALAAYSSTNGFKFGKHLADGTNLTLTKAYMGKALLMSSSSKTWTLPAANSVPAGTAVWILSQGAGNVVQRAGADNLHDGNTTATSVTLGLRDSLILESDGSSLWIIMGGSYHTSYQMVNQANVFTKGQAATWASLPATTGTVSPDFTTSNLFTGQVTGNVTFGNAYTGPGAGKGSMFMIRVQQNGSTAYNWAFGTNWKYEGGSSGIPPQTQTLSAWDEIIGEILTDGTISFKVRSNVG